MSEGGHAMGARAGFWQRLAAFWVDMLALYCGAYCFVALAEQANIRVSLEPVFVVLAALYGTILLGWRGETLGKMLLGLHVTSTGGDAIGYRTAVTRELLGKWLVTVGLPITVAKCFVGQAWIPTVLDTLILIPVLILFLAHYIIARRAWYDTLAGTTVLRHPAPRKRSRATAMSALITVTVLTLGFKALFFSTKGWTPTYLSIYRSGRSLRPYEAFLRRPHSTPVDYILEMFDQYDIVVLCERLHSEASQWNFIFDLISDRRFIERVGHVFTEYGKVDEQSHLDRFMATPGLSEEEINTRAIHTMRNLNFWPIWTNTNFFTYLKRLYRLNESLPVQERIRHYLSDVALTWEGLSKEGYQAFWQSLADRDSRMAERIIAEFNAIKASDALRKKCLVIMNYRHAFGPIKVPGAQALPSTCAFLCRAFPGSVANVLLNTSLLLVPVQGGAWDAAFEATGNRPVGFDLAGSPFGADPFDLFPFAPWLKGTCRYADVFTGFVFVHPLRDQYMEQGIPGYYTGFEEEALRRARLRDQDFASMVERSIAQHKEGRVRQRSQLPDRLVETCLDLALSAMFAMGLVIGLVACLLRTRSAD